MSRGEAQSGGAPGESWDALARAAARQHRGEDAGAALRELLCLKVGGDPYAVPVERVREIVRLRPVTAMPRVPREILGVISLRGEIVQVLDVRARLGVSSAEASRRTRIVVLHGDEGEVTGLLVDAVTEVLRVEEEAVRPPPTGESEFVSAICARGEEFVSLLNLERVLDLG